MNLSKEQKRAVEYIDSPQIILAGAGSGKTRVIVAKTKYLLEEKAYSPESILIITYSNKTQAELEQRMAGIGDSAIEIKTFHSFGMDIINEFGHLLDFGDEVVKASEYRLWQILKNAIAELRKSDLLNNSQPERVYGDIKRFIERAKNELVEPNEIIAGAKERLKELSEKSEEDDDIVEYFRWQNVLEAGKVYLSYERLKSEAGGIIDYSDMIFLAHKLLKNHRIVGAALRQKYRYVLVDEFQDTNYSQVELLYHLCGGKIGLTVVGDDDQAIYRFRGASFGSFLLFQKLFPGNKQFKLERNYRSSFNIVTAAQSSIEVAPDARFDPKKKMTADTSESDKVIIRFCPDDYTEAESAASEIKKLLRFNKYKKPKSIAVLFRNRNQKDIIARSLERRGIPFFYDKDIKEPASVLYRSFLAMYEFAVDPDRGDILSLLVRFFLPRIKPQLEREINYKLSRESDGALTVFSSMVAEMEDRFSDDALRLVELLERIIALKPKKTPVQLLEFILSETGILSSLIIDRKVTDHPAVKEVTGLLKAADAFMMEAPDGSHADFLEYYQWSDNIYQEDTSLVDNSDAPVIMQTIHGSKGLEYPVVFIIGLAQRKFPGSDRRGLVEFPKEFYKDSIPGTDFRMNEERRLFYVAMTRAEEKLYLYGVDKKRSRISKFVSELLKSPGFDKIGVKEDIAPVETILEKTYGPRDIQTRPGAIILPVEDDLHATLLAALNRIWDTIGSDIETSAEYSKLKKSFLDCVIAVSSEFKKTMARNKFQKPAGKTGVKIDSLSYTDMNSFSKCPLQFYFGSVLRMPSPSGPQLVFGSIIHSILEGVGKKLIAGEDVCVDSLVSEFKSRWKNVAFDDPDQKERMLLKAESSLANFVAMQSTMEGKPIDVERSFKFTIAGTQLRGKIDRIDKTTDGIEIIDYKTGKRNDNNLKSDLQLPIYSLACRELYGEYPAKVTYMFLTEDEPFSRTQSPEDLKKIEQDISEKIDEIINSDFTATPNSFICGYCGYNSICPAKA